MADEEMASHWFAPGYRAVQRLLPSYSDVLCVGCGDGTELDILPHARGLTLNIFGPLRGRRDVVCGDMHLLPFATGSFDAIFCKDTFEHALAPTIVLDEFCRVARRWFFLMVPDAEWALSPHHTIILTQEQMAVQAERRAWHVGHIVVKSEQHPEDRKPITWKMDCYLWSKPDANAIH
jgi:SAM-dependent methyltransferase